MKYTTPEMEIVRFESMEVMAASTETTSSIDLGEAGGDEI